MDGSAATRDEGGRGGQETMGEGMGRGSRVGLPLCDFGEVLVVFHGEGDENEDDAVRG